MSALLALFLNCPRYHYLFLDDQRYLTNKILTTDYKFLTINDRLRICYKDKNLFLKFKKLFNNLDLDDVRNAYNILKYLKDDMYLDLDTLEIVSDLNGYQYFDKWYQCCVEDDKSYFDNFINVLDKIYDYYIIIDVEYELQWKIYDKMTDDHMLNIDDNVLVSKRKKFLIKDPENCICSNNYENYLKFINWLIWYQVLDTRNIKTPAYNSKETISVAKKNEIWRTHMPNVFEDYCYCCRVNKITANSFSAGHVIPECAGGTLDVDNLRPICSSCNSSMATNNLFIWLEQQRLSGWYRALRKESVSVYLHFVSCGKYDFYDFYDFYVEWLKKYGKIQVLSKLECRYILIGKGVYDQDIEKVVIN